jgi:hypothetical protein
MRLNIFVHDTCLLLNFKFAFVYGLLSRAVLFKNVDRLQKAASHHDSSAAVRVLRSTPIVRYHLKSSALSGAVEAFVSNADDKDRILRLLSSISQARL